MMLLSGARAKADWATRFSDVIGIPGSEIAAFDGCPVDRLGLLACVQDACHPIPFQIDARDPQGLWVLDRGPEPSQVPQPSGVGRNDLLLFMAADAADRARPDALPAAAPAAEISVHDPLSGATRWVYLLAFPHEAPRSEVSYVDYEPATDRVRGARVTLGFRHGMPGYLAVSECGDANLLDRFKVRATATFLWGLIRLSRNEDDLSTEFVGWRQGPIRILRRQRQWVRIGWGIRSPTFGSYTYFYRDFAELPVSLHLNFKPTYFFGNIVIRAVLDFRDLRGWSVLAPSAGTPIPIDGYMTGQKEALSRFSDRWFALLGPQITLVEDMDVSASLVSVQRRLFYREDVVQSDPPEEVPGQEPGIGYRLDHWEHVGAGTHQLRSVSYALPVGLDVRAFMTARNTPLQAVAHTLPPTAGPDARREATHTDRPTQRARP
jgi:hypothetical protein